MQRPVRGIDILALVFAIVCLLEAALGLLLQPIYLKMFAEFGSALPWFTILMLRPTTLVVIGLLPMVLVVEGLLMRRSETAVLVRCVIAMACALFLVIGFIASVYLPIFSLAGQIH